MTSVQTGKLNGCSLVAEMGAIRDFSKRSVSCTSVTLACSCWLWRKC